MKNQKSLPLRKALYGALAALGFGAVNHATYGAEELFANSGFDTDAPGWSWENWSAAGSSVSFDASQNSAVFGRCG